MPLKYEILEEVKKKILEVPSRLDMKTWGRTNMEPGSYWNSFRYVSFRYVPECGTVGCIAGWVGVIVEKRIANALKAEMLLGTVGDSIDIRNLFYVEQWSTKNQIRYDEAESNCDLQGMAEACAAEIDLVIQLYREKGQLIEGGVKKQC